MRTFRAGGVTFCANATIRAKPPFRALHKKTNSAQKRRSLHKKVKWRAVISGSPLSVRVIPQCYCVEWFEVWEMEMNAYECMDMYRNDQIVNIYIPSPKTV